MKVWVIMENDFPCGVRATEGEASRFVEERKAAWEAKWAGEDRLVKAVSRSRVYVRSYDFEMPTAELMAGEAQVMERVVGARMETVPYVTYTAGGESDA